jgi:hypothetical protein
LTPLPSFAMADQPAWELTSEQRGRVRESVDVPALERLLASVPAAERAVVFLSFCADPAAEEGLDALRAAGVSETELEELRQLAQYEPLPPHLAHPENDPDPNWTAPAANLIFQLQPPEDAGLRALWEAVEPRHG